MNFFYNKKRLLVKIGIILILILIIMLPIYFLVIKKSTSSNTPLSLNTSVIMNAPAAKSIITPPNMLGFCFVSTTNGVDSPLKFMPEPMWDIKGMQLMFSNADNGIRAQNKTLNKWAYDSNNKLYITRTINNTNNTDDAYTQSELKALGTPDADASAPNTYKVNKLIPIYDPNNPNLTKDIQMEIRPWTLSLYSDCK